VGERRDGEGKWVESLAGGALLSVSYVVWALSGVSPVGRGWPRGIQQFFGSRWTKFIFRNHGWTLFLSGALIALGLYGMTGACLSRRSLALQKHIRSGRLSLKHISVFSWHFGKLMRRVFYL
jgi:hypothetical protein